MLVTRDSFYSIVRKLSYPGEYGLDTETTGLGESDRPFSIILSDESESYYFNFKNTPDHLGQLPPDECILPTEWLEHLKVVFSNKQSLFYIHNAKFDLKMLRFVGLDLASNVWCTQAMERVVQNNHMGAKPYSLDACAKRRGVEKSAAVDKYISSNRLFESSTVPGKKKIFQHKHYDQVPFDIMSEYAMTDGSLALKLGKDQKETLAELEKIRGAAPSILPLIENETKLTKVCFNMERVGVKIRRDYVQAGLEHELSQIRAYSTQFREMTGLEFNDGRTCLTEAFTKMGEPYPFTPKGNPSFSGEVLENMATPLAAIVTSIREHSKRAGTYYSSFLYFADSHDVIHPTMNQGGTETGRFSYSDPNLQNVPKEDDPTDAQKPFIIRSSFAPFEDTCFVMIDYQQQEFRLMLDYAGERTLIRSVNEGADVHQATADLVKISRKEAKTVNFGLLYGMGDVKLAAQLFPVTLPLMLLDLVWMKHNGKRLFPKERDQLDKIPNEVQRVNLEFILQAKDIKQTYFSKLPKVKGFLDEVRSKGKARGYVWNWFGRRCHISDKNFAYILPNHIIQGGGADIIKIAMVEMEEILSPLRSKMQLQVHDEVLFGIHKDELDVIPKLHRIMESIYKSKNGIRLTCSVEHSWKSWGAPDKVKGLP